MPKLRSGEVLTPARRETIIYEPGSRGGICFSKLSLPPGVLDHCEMARRVEYGMMSLGVSKIYDLSSSARVAGNKSGNGLRVSTR